MILNIDDIAVIDRSREDLGDIDALAQSIKTHGQISPVAVRPADDNDRVAGITEPWVLVAGGRRMAACMKLGLETIHAHSMDELSPFMHKSIELEENLRRLAMSPAEEVMAKKQIHALRVAEAAANGIVWSQADTARELGETPANMSRDLRLADAMEADPRLQAAESKAGAIRQIDFAAKIESRLAAIDRSDLSIVGSKLVTADMRDFIRTLPARSVDLNFTDFPFGIQYNFDTQDLNKYEDSKRTLSDLLTDIIPQMIRVTKSTGWMALMMGSTNYNLLVDLIETCCAEHFEYFDTRYEKQPNGEWKQLVKGGCAKGQVGSPCRRLKVEDPEWLWFRPNSRNPSMHPELHAQNQYEKIAVVNMGSAVMVQKNLGNVLVHEAIYTDRIHEMQRPHPLCCDVINRLTVPGEKVADFCYGSGSALAAAADLKRDFIGCDINPVNRGPAISFVSSYAKAG